MILLKTSDGNHFGERGSWFFNPFWSGKAVEDPDRAWVRPALRNPSDIKLGEPGLLQAFRPHQDFRGFLGLLAPVRKQAS